MGALVGGIYAAGHLDTFADWAMRLNRRAVVRLLDWSFGSGAIFKGERIIAELRSLLGDCLIEDLPIGYTAVATDLEEMREVWFSRGPLWHAVRASIAVPLVFAPVMRDGRVLIDGGLINPVPIAPTFNGGAGATVAVDLNGARVRQEQAGRAAAAPGAAEHAEWEGVSALREHLPKVVAELVSAQPDAKARAPSAFELAMRSMEGMQATITRMKLAAYAPDLVIHVPRNLATFFEFHRAAELVEFGYQRTRRVLEQHEAMTDDEPEVNRTPEAE